MCRFHYDYIKKKYPGAQLLFTDTDSLYYHIETPDIEKDLFSDKDLFDNSEYDERSPYYDPTNKKLIGKFKCETHGLPITEYVGLRPKMYSYLFKDSTKPGAPLKEKLRAKGISKAAARTLTHEAYKKELLNPTMNYVTNRRLGTNLHRLYAFKV